MKFLVEIREIWVDPEDDQVVGAKVNRSRYSPIMTIRAPDKESANKLAMSLFCTHKDSIRDVTTKQIDEPLGLLDRIFGRFYLEASIPAKKE